MTTHTEGEIKALIGPVLGEKPEDIDHFVIIVKGRCDRCGGRDGYVVLDSADNLIDFIDLMNGGVDCRVATPQ